MTKTVSVNNVIT